MAAALGFGDVLARHFAAHVKKRSRRERLGEVLLFNALADAFGSARSLRVMSDVFHGTSHQVVFRIGKRDHRCELCDLLIIAFDLPRIREARMTCFQAKFDRRLIDLKGSRFRVGANLIQLALLGGRPEIAGWGAFAPPKDLLSAPGTLSTVGTFGFFVRNGPGHELLYASADAIAVPGRRTYHRRYRDVLLSDAPANRAEETIFARSLAGFGDALAAMRIGTPVALNSSTASGAWLTGLVEQICARWPYDYLANALLGRIRANTDGRDAETPPIDKPPRDPQEQRFLDGYWDRFPLSGPPVRKPPPPPGARGDGDGPLAGVPTVVLIGTHSRD